AGREIEPAADEQRQRERERKRREPVLGGEQDDDGYRNMLSEQLHPRTAPERERGAVYGAEIADALNQSTEPATAGPRPRPIRTAERAVPRAADRGAPPLAFGFFL